jgi:alanine racemase
MRPTWVEIDLAAIKHNLREIRRTTHPRASIMAVVKANAYGHGVDEVARTVLANGTDRLAVAIPHEGIYLRQRGITVPILIMGLTLPEQADEIVQHDLHPAVATWESAQALAAAAARCRKEVQVFVKIDTGMHRVGIASGDTVSFIKRLTNLKDLCVAGVFTHFSVADIQDKTYTHGQFDTLNNIIHALHRENITIPLISAANSAAVLDLPETHFDIVRPGIILYGLAPSAEISNKIPLIPAMQFKTRIVYVKKVTKGCKIGYGCTYVTPRDAIIATMPVGYADGYNRLLSNHGEVLIHGVRCPVVGRVCMDQIMADVTPISSVAIGDEAVLFGCQGNEEISIDEIAQKIGTINYEVVCGISERVPRVYINRD